METQNRKTRIISIVTVVLVGWLFAQLALLGIRYFFPQEGSRVAETVQSGQRVETLPTPYMCRPVKTEVDFVDVPTAGVEEEVALPLGDGGKVAISSFGGGIARASYLKWCDGVASDLVIIGQHTGLEREESALLVALDEKTPYFYKMVGGVQEGGTVTMVSDTDQARITKTFQTKGQLIEMTVSIEPLISGKPLQPRILIPTPFLGDVTNRKMTSGFVFGIREKLEKVEMNQIAGAAWAMPKFFGVQSRYFAFGMVRDEDRFAQRAYFKHAPNGQLTGIIEGPEITTKTSWRLQFYLGPKEPNAFAAVDSRLDGLLEYGWFSFLAKWLMALLNYINGFIHNYGWSIILVTLLINLLILPFSWKQGDQNVNAMSDYQRKMKYVESRYADDPERLREEKLELIKKYGAFPGLSGCLPMLLQLPIFFGLGSALRNSFELYQAPFVFWIKDLSAHDPYYILPALFGISLFFSVVPNAKTVRQTVLYFFLALFSAGFMMNISAGLVLFLVTSGSVRLIQTKVTKLFKAIVR